MVDLKIETRTTTKIVLLARYFKFKYRLKSYYKVKCIANHVNVLIPVPSDAYKPAFNT